MNIAIFLANAAESHAARPAISSGDELYCSYGELGRRVAKLAGGLQAQPFLKPGDRIGLAMSNCPQYLEILFAIWHAGYCAVPTNARLHGRELAFMLENCGAKYCFVSADIAEGLAAHCASVPELEQLIVTGEKDYDRLVQAEPVGMASLAAENPAWLFYTSGTTGKPKAAILSHRNLAVMALGYLADVDFLDETDCLIHLAAQSHASGLFALSHIPRASHQIVPASGGFDIGELATLIADNRKISFFVPPTLLRRLSVDGVMAALPLDHIKTILCGAAPVYADDLKQALARFGPCIWNGYGQGESPCTITAMSKSMLAAAAESGNDERLISVGIARTGVEVSLRDDTGKLVAPGEVGEVTVRGDVVMQGYWQNEQASAAALTPQGLRTGDLGTFDDAGYLSLKDRATDMIISGGINIYPREVEEVLLSSSEVAEVAVVGAPDAEWGERVTAFIVAKGPGAVDETALDSLCLEQIARFKRPRAYHMLAELPKNSYGKVLKTELRRSLQSEDNI
ncbi:MAG: AMP-binding protein [Rhodospirillaceae bacterium]|jgi:long-chain acyl-CoA synthetase|nr:AMP-binding protein [Rhodospirillaceae bacterium]